jgi:hypothetical protein
MVRFPGSSPGSAARTVLNFGRLQGPLGPRKKLSKKIGGLTKKIDKDVAVEEAQS